MDSFPLTTPTIITSNIYHYSLAKLRHMITFLQPKLGHRHGHRDLPALCLALERASQLLHKVQEHVLVAKTALTIGCARILPIQIETVESVAVHVLHNACDERLPTFATRYHFRIFSATFAPAADGHLQLEGRMRATQCGKVTETIVVNVNL